MSYLLVFALCLIAASLFSDLAGRTILSISAFFLIAGYLSRIVGIGHVSSSDPIVSGLVDITLVSVLYTDASKVGIKDLIHTWHLPGRALLLGFPLTFLGTALLAKYIAGVSWLQAMLLGAVLSPTDPVFVSTLVQSEKVPERLRYMLNVESGVNDGLALPLVLLLMSKIGSGPISHGEILFELLIGIAIGVGVPFLTLLLERSRIFSTTHAYVPVMGFAVILTVYSLCKNLNANEFLGAFAAGVTVKSCETNYQERFFKFVEDLSEVLKLAALFVFGGLISASTLRELGVAEILFVALTVLFIRPIAIEIALMRSSLNWKERAVAGLFGPKGFASVMFGLLILSSQVPNHVHLFHLIALVVSSSILLLSSTDIFVEMWFEKSK